jgi:hypothetical protein
MGANSSGRVPKASPKSHLHDATSNVTSRCFAASDPTVMVMAAIKNAAKEKKEVEFILSKPHRVGRSRV